jgi:hypothetical protein
MKRILIIVFAWISFFDFSMLYSQQKKTEGKFAYASSLMQGRWYIAATNFKLWLNGKYSGPGNNYTNFRIKNNKLRFDDLLIFYSGEKENHLKGKLVQKNENKPDFVWRGKGLFFWMKSKWRIVASDTEGQWIVLYSTKTATSPEGMDILSRNKKMPEKEIKNIISHIDVAYIKKPLRIL